MNIVPDGGLFPSGIFSYPEDSEMDILEQLADHARERVEEKKRIIPPGEMKRLADTVKPAARISFAEALAKPEMSFICECKKASPSKGLIDPEFPYLRIAKDYETAGADAISCLTEPKWFLGRDEYLRKIAGMVRIPVLRKDFTVDPYMIYEAKVLGASAVLLICSILSPEELKDDLQLAESLGLDVLTETHDEAEIEMAVSAGATILGVNNRNLRDFTVDIHNSIRLRALVPDHIRMVAESGIRTRDDILTLEQSGISGVLIGETLMNATDKRTMLRELKGEPL